MVSKPAISNSPSQLHKVAVAPLVLDENFEANPLRKRREKKKESSVITRLFPEETPWSPEILSERPGSASRKKVKDSPQSNRKPWSYQDDLPPSPSSTTARLRKDAEFVSVSRKTSAHYHHPSSASSTRSQTVPPTEGISLKDYVDSFHQVSEGPDARPLNRQRNSLRNSAENITLLSCQTLDNRPLTRQKHPTESLDLFLPNPPGDDASSDSSHDEKPEIGQDYPNYTCLFMASDNEFGEEPAFPSKSGAAFRVSQVVWNEAFVEEGRDGLLESESGRRIKKSDKSYKKAKEKAKNFAVIPASEDKQHMETLSKGVEEVTAPDHDDKDATLYDLLLDQKGSIKGIPVEAVPISPSPFGIGPQKGRRVRHVDPIASKSGSEDDSKRTPSRPNSSRRVTRMGSISEKSTSEIFEENPESQL